MKLVESNKNFMSTTEIYSLMDKEMPKFAPKGAAVSMSPCLLANTFCVDFYQLYKQQFDEGDKIIQDLVHKSESLEEIEEKRVEKIRMQAREKLK